MVRSIERNVALYHWFQGSASLMAWLPVFFLYFIQFVSLSEAIQLGAIYYISVCIWEVPSGYFSDRVGRKLTLLISGVSIFLSYAVFIAANDFVSLALGQCLLALGMAMMSGTDSAFLYDSLLALERQDEYEKFEAKGQKYGFSSLTLASILGGILGQLDFRLAYVVSLIGAVWMLSLVWQFVEPEQVCSKFRQVNTPLHSIKVCLSRLSDQVLRWLFAVMVLMYCLEHVAFEFYQPYIKLLDLNILASDGSPLISGIVIAISMFGGTLGAAYSIQLNKRLGLRKLLFVAFAVQLFIIGVFSLLLSVVVLAMLFLRNFPMAMIYAPVNAAIAPRIQSDYRATYLSLQSLSARLAFSLLLYFLSQTIGANGALDWSNLSLVLREALLFGLIVAGILCLISPKLPK